MLTNLYAIYTTMCDKDGVSNKDQYTHYEFLEEVATYWMNPKVASRESASTHASASAIRTMGSPAGSTISAITADSSFSTTSSNRKKKFSNNSLGPRNWFV